MRRQSLETWLDAANIAALLLVGLVLVELATVLALGLWQAARQTPLSPESCAWLGAVWWDHAGINDLVAKLGNTPRAVFCTMGLVPRFFCILALPIGFVWMVTYWVIRVEQTEAPSLVAGDDFIRLFLAFICIFKFATAPYEALAAGRGSLAVLVIVYLLISIGQLLIIFLFQRRLNVLVAVSVRS